MIKTQKTRIAALLLVLVTLFTALFIPINAADAETDGNVGIEEIMPRRAYGCYNYTIYNSLQSCYGYDETFVPSGKTFYKTMTNEDLYDYFNDLSPGNWKKAYQNGYIDGVECSIHYFRNMTTGNSYAGYKVVSGWVE